MEIPQVMMISEMEPVLLTLEMMILILEVENLMELQIQKEMELLMAIKFLHLAVMKVQEVNNLEAEVMPQEVRAQGLMEV
jgi:hypothetical protein